MKSLRVSRTRSTITPHIVDLTKHRRIRHTRASRSSPFPRSLEVPASRTSSSSSLTRLGSSTPTSCWRSPPTTRPSNSEGKVENPLESSMNCLHVGTHGTHDPTTCARLQTDGLGKRTVSETPCQTEGTKDDRNHPGFLTCEDAHSMFVIRAPPVARSSCQRSPSGFNGSLFDGSPSNAT